MVSVSNSVSGTYVFRACFEAERAEFVQIRHLAPQRGIRSISIHVRRRRRAPDHSAAKLWRSGCVDIQYRQASDPAPTGRMRPDKGDPFFLTRFGGCRILNRR